MSPTTNHDAVVIDANISISICSNEPSSFTAEIALENYAQNGFEFFAPNVIVAEVLYVLCLKLQNGLLTQKAYEEALENLQDQMTLIKTFDDAQLIKRATEIRGSYGCSRMSDCLYIALAEELGKNRRAELLTFDSDMTNQIRKNAPTVILNILPV